MHIWVDADACPATIREILCRLADRKSLSLTFVANQFIPTPPSKFIKSIRVASGFDVADNTIVELCSVGDLVITCDIPLADEVISKGGLALSWRGELFDRNNIKARLNMRDFYDTLRSSGIQSKGPAPLSAADKQAFANHLDRLTAKY
ncbi:YaiI/YqxD family protein [Thalassotalea maritima]|uniref:YaiI/YqxD family protein n=1 Tax=Thalassotalea maritima TaxID=3242416 RepID=UPI0035294D04